MRRRGGMVIGVLVGVLALAAAGCGDDDDNAGSASATTAAPAAGSYEFHCKYHAATMKGTVTVT